nr:hypothetical protein [Pedobacter kyonggii]
MGSISLKSAGTYLLHRSLNLDYKLGRLLIDSIVSYGFNYPLMKYWVFKINKLGISEAEEEEDYFETPGEEQRV